MKILRKEHVLSSEMEKLVAMTGEMAQTPEQVYSIINNADLIYPEIEDENGEKVRLSHGNFVPFEESGDRRVRKDAFEAFYSIYKQFAGTIARTLQRTGKAADFLCEGEKLCVYAGSGSRCEQWCRRRFTAIWWRP